MTPIRYDRFFGRLLLVSRLTPTAPIWAIKRTMKETGGQGEGVNGGSERGCRRAA